MNFEIVNEFENNIKNFFGAPYAVSVDSCTHGIELCLRLLDSKKIIVPKRTYISIPFLAHKLNIDLIWSSKVWEDYYFLTPEIADAAVLWEKDSYLEGKFMCISFQYQKHLSLGRGGIILCPDRESHDALKRMSYDGRMSGIAWRDQNIETIGYHYYMTPETANKGLLKWDEAVKTQPKQWVVSDWPDLTQMDIFK